MQTVRMSHSRPRLSFSVQRDLRRRQARPHACQAGAFDAASYRQLTRQLNRRVANYLRARAEQDAHRRRQELVAAQDARIGRVEDLLQELSAAGWRHREIEYAAEHGAFHGLPKDMTDAGASIRAPVPR